MRTLRVGLTVLLGSLLCVSSAIATHVCSDGLESTLLKRHSDAWAQERIAADQQGRSVDIQNIEKSSPLYRRMRTILKESTTPDFALKSARDFIKKYEKDFLQEDLAYVVRWAFRLEAEFGFEVAVKLRAIPFNKESSNQMKAYAIANVGAPLALMRVEAATAEKPITSEEVLSWFTQQETSLLFLRHFGGRAEKQALLELRANLQKNRFWPLIEKTSYAISLNQIIDGSK